MTVCEHLLRLACHTYTCTYIAEYTCLSHSSLSHSSLSHSSRRITKSCIYTASTLIEFYWQSKSLENFIDNVVYSKYKLVLTDWQVDYSLHFDLLFLLSSATRVMSRPEDSFTCCVQYYQGVIWNLAVAANSIDNSSVARELSQLHFTISKLYIKCLSSNYTPKWIYSSLLPAKSHAKRKLQPQQPPLPPTLNSVLTAK